MNLLPIVLLATASAFPSASRTSWMSPESFHLQLGKKKSAVVAKLREDGWKTEKGKAENHLIVPYSDRSTITLAFEKDRLQSIRFELVDFIPQVKEAFSEQKEILEDKLGKPGKTLRNGSILIYDKKAPKVMAVMSTDRKSSFGKQGLGFLVVRYFDPPR